MSIAPVEEWPLVGRARELERLTELLAGPGGAGVLLSGPSGVGKSRLAEECVLLGRQAGMRCERIRATRSSSAIPLGALAFLLPPTPVGLELRGDFLREAINALSGGADERALLVIDDVHLLDGASATVINQLVMTRRCFVVMTARSGEPAPDPITALWKDLAVERIDLQLLSQDDVDELLRAAFGGRIDGATLREFWHASRGNALFVRELVLGAVHAGILRSDGAIWRLDRRLTSPPRLVELVEARLADLDDLERAAIELVAAGEPIEVDILIDLGVGPETLESLSRDGLVTLDQEVGRHRVRLAHPLHGEVLRQQMTAIARMMISRRLADTLDERLGDAATIDAADVVRMAVWRLEGGGRVDQELMLSAARQAFFASDQILAERLTRAAVDAGAGIEGGLLLAQIFEAQSRHDEAEGLLSELEGRATTDRQRTLIVIERAVTLIWGLDRGDDALEALTAASRRVSAGPWRDELEAQKITVEALLGRVESVIASGWSMVAGSPPQTRAAVTAAVGMAPALAVAGRCLDSIDVADRAFAARIGLDDQEVLSEAGIYLVARSLALGELGRLAEAAGTADAGYEASVAGRHPLGQAWFALMRGRIGLLSGRLTFSIDQFCEGAAVFGQAGRSGARRWCAAGRMIAAAMRADLDELDAAEADLDAMGPSSMLLMEPDVLRARAWSAIARGLESDGRKLMIAAAEMAVANGAWAHATTAWHDLARIGDPATGANGLAKAVGRVDGELATARHDHAFALAARDPSRLIDCSDRFESLGALLFAAESAAGAAAELEQAGDRRPSQRIALRAEELVSRCEGASTPALRTQGAPAVLSRREREVARLAATGMSSKAIAVQLFLSARTVDTHLQTAYVKLGISGRNELADALKATGIT